MKSILSPYDDYYFNEYLLAYIKKYLKRRCLKLIKDDDSRKYLLEDNRREYYTPYDIISSLKLNGRLIYFSNQQLINYAVYDLGQRFWYEELKNINNLIHTLYIKYKGTSYGKEDHLYRYRRPR